VKRPPIARSLFQQHTLRTLLAGGAVRSFDQDLTGSAKNYWGRYRQSWDAFCQRMDDAGLPLVRVERINPSTRRKYLVYVIGKD
jgi:hypothetical protein